MNQPTRWDLPSARELRAIVRELNKQGKTVIYTTHIMAEAETLCNRVAIIDQGEVIAQGTVPDLKESIGQENGDSIGRSPFPRRRVRPFPPSMALRAQQLRPSMVIAN